MRYVTGIEWRAIKRCLEQGIEQEILKAARETVIDILAERFQRIPEQLVAHVNALADPALLKLLHKRAVTIPSLADFQRLLTEQVKPSVAVPVNSV